MQKGCLGPMLTLVKTLDDLFDYLMTLGLILYI